MKSFALIFLCLAAPLSAQTTVAAPAAGIAVSTAAAAETNKVKTAKPSEPARYEASKVPLSGIVLTPTAYRGKGENAIGLNLDANASYYIGRLYGKNTYSWTTSKTNYLDRVGYWMLSVDAKMLIQTEGRWRPAMASGVQGIFKFRDAPQSALTFTIKATGKATDTSANAYLVLTKRIHPKFILNAGYSDGDMPKVLYQLSEFLSKEALRLNGITNTSVPTGMLFGGVMWLPKPDSPLGLEVLIPQGAPQSPKLFNLHLGTLLKMNFEISYLSFKGGWDLMGMFQFRLNMLSAGINAKV